MSKVLLVLMVVLAVVIGFVLWQIGYPVLYVRSIPPQQVSRWQVLALDGWTISGSFYQLTFQGKGILGYTAFGPTVLVLLGEGQVRVLPAQAKQTGRLVLGPPPKLKSGPLPESEITALFARGYLRLHPEDSAWPRDFPQQEDVQALQEAQALHTEKLPRYLSAGDQVRIPQLAVRVIELETTQGSLLLLDSPRQTAVYWLSP